MRISSLLIGLLLPATVSAASIFDLQWEYANTSLKTTKPTKEITKFVIEEAKKWNGHGVILKAGDIEAALTGREDILCNDKKNAAGKEITFAKGGVAVIGTCGALLQDIAALVASETDAQQLGDELLTIANSAELATADEPRPLLDISSSLRGLKRVWQATGSTVLPWNPEADDAIAALNQALQKAEDDESLEEVMLRFHHGFFRDVWEKDQRWNSGDDVESALSYVAAVLGSDPRNTVVHEIATPGLDNPNIRLWARTDDLGLLWVTPLSYYRPTITPASDYTRFRDNGDRLAYPFAYEGGETFPDSIRSPLCSRSMGRYGFLCRPLPSINEGCTKPIRSDAITLIECQSQEKVKTVPQTLPSCTELTPLFTDDDTPLFSPPGTLNSKLVRAKAGTICQPGSKVKYPASILSNLCYAQACVAESLSGHSLIPGRNAVLAYESTSPFLSCIRPDPQLGFYGESSAAVPAAPPPYLGPEHVKDFIREYCSEHGNAPHPLAGFCRGQDNIRAAEPLAAQAAHFSRVSSEQNTLNAAQQRINILATSLGLRHAVDASVLLRPKVLAPLAAFVQHTANLFQELKRAPLTKSACPWTGPFLPPSTAP